MIESENVDFLAYVQCELTDPPVMSVMPVAMYHPAIC